MSQEYLDFELPIAELEAKIEALRSASDDKIDLHDEIKRLQKKSDELTKKTFANLDAWQVSRMARHPNRPYTLDYIEHIFTDFKELAGDRAFADDKANRRWSSSLRWSPSNDYRSPKRSYSKR
ncbi:MAG: hypothetical protein ACLR5N_04790 [Haemophilus parainfluenzae]